MRCSPPHKLPPISLVFPPNFPFCVPPQLSAMKGELGEAERFLHQALHLAHQADDKRAIVYTYSMVTAARCCPARGRAVSQGTGTAWCWEAVCGRTRGGGEAGPGGGAFSATSVSSRWQTWPSCRGSWTT